MAVLAATVDDVLAGADAGGEESGGLRAEKVERDELVEGAELHYWLLENNPTAGVVYRLRVHERTRDRLE